MFGIYNVFMENGLDLREYASRVCSELLSGHNIPHQMAIQGGLKMGQVTDGIAYLEGEGIKFTKKAGRYCFDKPNREKLNEFLRLNR
jgi:hypothetical protein